MNDYKTLLIACWFHQPPVNSLRNIIIFTSQFFPKTVLIHPGYCISLCRPSIGDNLVGNVLFLGSGFHILVVSWHQMSMFIWGSVVVVIPGQYESHFSVLLKSLILVTDTFTDMKILSFCVAKKCCNLGVIICLFWFTIFFYRLFILFKTFSLFKY